MSDRTADLVKGRRVLVVEDEFLIAEDLRLALEDLGAEVVGPVATVDAALDAVRLERGLDGATLDIMLRGEKSFPVAEALKARGLPFVLLTGYSDRAVPEGLRDAPRCPKPFDVRQIVRALFPRGQDARPPAR
jgi:CheY-like chemotaxis protein